MKIAILDPRCHATGLKLLFPESDYFVIPQNNYYDLDKNPAKFYNLYGFNFKENIDCITSDNYDYLFIVYSVEDFKDKSRQFEQYHYSQILNIVNNPKNKFKKIIGFANDDWDNDPSFFRELNVDIWFKRNYSKNITYSENVKSFPFIIFGHKCPLWTCLIGEYKNIQPTENRILWSGSKYGKVLNDSYITREQVLNDNNILRHLCIKHVNRDEYCREIALSKFTLDINGVGDPNIRTLEAISTSTLLIQQHRDLIWPFDDGDNFSEETIYKTINDLDKIIINLRTNDEIYKKCLINQIYLRDKYFNSSWLRNYINKFL